MEVVMFMKLPLLTPATGLGLSEDLHEEYCIAQLVRMHVSRIHCKSCGACNFVTLYKIAAILSMCIYIGIGLMSLDTLLPKR